MLQIIETALTRNLNSSLSWAKNLIGLHEDKVVLVTGGSVGIGGQIGRVLAMSGAKVMLAARRSAQLEQLKQSIIGELELAGYPEAEKRVQVEADCDVGNPADMKRLVERTLACYGHVDYLINNAGIVGAEDMVIDMPLDGWRYTLEANLNSNYDLLRQLAPIMKARGSGHVINVSSYFGGEKYVAIAYPNRADYAVSKAGQRAMVESFARFLGPEIQINCIAPGPVDGERLRGSSERPSMFNRRAKVVLENKRLNDIYSALIVENRRNIHTFEELLATVLANDLLAVIANPKQPESFRELATNIQEQSNPEGSSSRFFLNQRLAVKLVRRLEAGGYLKVKLDEQDKTGDKLLAVVPPEPFFTPTELEREGERVRNRNLGMLHLKRIPTDLDVAISTCYYLADHNITGETFHSSGGLKFERAVTEGELFGKPSPERLESLRGGVIFLVGEYLQEHLSRLTEVFLAEYGVARIVALTETEAGAEEFQAAFPIYTTDGRLVTIATNGNIEEGFDRARSLYGVPEVVVSTPFHSLPTCPLEAPGSGDWSAVLDHAGFATLVENQLTHHFRVAKKTAVLDNVRLVLVTPATTARSTDEEFALANFIKTTLHSFTATFGIETERTVHHGAVNQVDLARRARDEEPRNPQEQEEELVRFVNAILLTSATLPSPEESRYQARIYRGNAITV